MNAVPQTGGFDKSSLPVIECTTTSSLVAKISQQTDLKRGTFLKRQGSGASKFEEWKTQNIVNYTAWVLA